MSKKITDLTALAAIEADDYFVVQEDSSGITKKMKIAAILTYLTANLDDIASDLDVGAATTRRVAPAGTLVNNANGNPNISGTQITISSSVTEVTWESIGPTASGADNIWAALDSVPLDADWIRIRARIYGSAATAAADAACSIWVLARDGDSSEAADTYDNGIGQIAATVNNNGDCSAGVVVEATIPVNAANVFDTYWDNTFFQTTEIKFTLIGWGFNPTS